MSLSSNNIYSEVTPQIVDLAQQAATADKIEQELYNRFDVKRGLRDRAGKGVLAGLTNVAEIKAKKIVDGIEVPDFGHLFYRGYAIEDLIAGIEMDDRFGYEEIAFLLLIGHLPTVDELREFSDKLLFYRSLPSKFVRDIIMKVPSTDMMNTLQRSVLTLYAYDDKADDVSLPNILRQSMQLTSLLPMIGLYGYKVYQHYEMGESLIIHQPLTHGSMAENILHMLRDDGHYSELEAHILDICLVLHMDHGGGNNSAFTTHVVTSTLTDTYSAMTAALGSLKGPRHGGANIKVVKMFDDMKKTVGNWKDEDEVSAYLAGLLRGEGFDHSGLIYGVGHAVYSMSDPRAVIFKSYVEKLAKAKGCEKEFELYSLVEKLAPKVIEKERKIYKGVCVNVDFYSGFVYRMLGLPEELFTPLFAMARIVGWSAHRMEEIANNGKIIRPAYRAIAENLPYLGLEYR